MRIWISILLVVAAGCGYLAWYVADWWTSPLPIATTATVSVQAGDTVNDLARRLQDAGALEYPDLLRWTTQLHGLAGSLRVGEYTLKAGDTPQQVIARITRGEVISYRFRIMEGTRLKAVLEGLRAEPKLRQTLRAASPATLLAELGIDGADGSGHGEGWFFPDTYRFVAGDEDRQLLMRAHLKMREELAAAWATRTSELPYRTPYEALIVASIIEKETGRAEDRADISQVIAARFARNMRLQVDPTVIYGLGGSFNGNLTRADLKEPTPYNTYVHKGLPPTPIGLPGREALHAALQPSGAPYLYFVSRGDGSSQFSTTLEEHRAAVNKYQRQTD